MPNSLAQFASGLGRLARGTIMVEALEHEILEKSCKIVEEEAKRVIGTYDYGWPPLAESTLKQKAADTPLLETGELRESISHYVEFGEPVGYVGSPLKIALYQELGTNNIPPRSFLMGASKAKEHEVHELGAATHFAMGAILGLQLPGITHAITEVIDKAGAK